MIIEYLFTFILGLFIGSFLNCIVLRVYDKKSFVKGKSMCPHCGHKLETLDLVPVFSYIFLKGRCRYCKEKISRQYLYAEL